MFRRIRRIAWEDANVFFINSKMILILFEFIFFCETFMVHVKELCKLSGFKVSYFEPYLLIACGDMFFLAIPLVYMVLLLGFPSKRSMNYFSLIRVSRLEWVIGEFVFLIISAIGYMIMLIAGLVIYMNKYVTYQNDWSAYMLDYHKTNPDVFETNTDYFLDVSMMTHGNPMKVCVHSVLLMLCMLVCLALTQMLFTILNKKYMGVLIILGMTLGSALSSYSNSIVKWIFPMTHTNYGVHFDGIRAQKNMGLEISYLYFGVLIIILLGLNIFIAKKINMDG